MIFFPSKFRSSFRLQSKVMFYQFHAVKNSMNALILPSARSQEKAFIQKLIDSKIGDMRAFSINVTSVMGIGFLYDIRCLVIKVS